MAKIKKYKGFTLVELIVVISIIAILAAIAIPTSLYYVQKANISKEIQEMNSVNAIQSIFIEAKNKNIDITNTSEDSDIKITNLLESIDLPYKYLGIIEIYIKGTADNWEVTFILKGQEYGDRADGSKLTCTVATIFTNEQLFSGSSEIPTSDTKYIYKIDKNTGKIVKI